MEKYFKIGQEVWNINGEAGTVVECKDDPTLKFPLIVEFSENEAYTHDGRLHTHSEVSLFQTAPIITPNVPINEFKQGELVWAKTSKDAEVWDIRFFSHIKNEIYHCFQGQKKDGYTSCFYKIQKFNDNPLLPPK